MTFDDADQSPLDNLSPSQQTLVNRSTESKLFLKGPAGTGKTTAGVARMLHLLESGVSARSMMVFTPQRTLSVPYYEALHRPFLDTRGRVTLLTLGGLAQRMVDLFWPLIVEEAGFGFPERPPTFLTLETAQYYMARVIRPLLNEGAFESVTIDRNRLYSQIIDNLNKSAVVGFPYTQIGQRLKGAWGGEPGRERIYEEAQICANRFRRYCLDHNLLDFSLQVEVFRKHLWARPICQDYLTDRYQHILVDNVEEDVPVAHDLLREWIPSSQSVLLIYDSGAGYRRFLGADPQSARRLRDLCDDHVTFSNSFVMSSDVAALAAALSSELGPGDRGPRDYNSETTRDVKRTLVFEPCRYYPQMLDWVADRVAILVKEETVPPGEIVVLAPFLSDALRFSLVNRLEARNVPVRSHRPSRALREEAATHCLLTLSAIAHPPWGLRPTKYDVASALIQAIEGMDLVRAQLLSSIAYRVSEGVPSLSSFDAIEPEMQERLTYVLGERYEGLRGWIEAYVDDSQQDVPLDHFLSRLFGELLSQQGYGFHRDFDGAEVAANLVESVRKFRWVTEDGGYPHEGGGEAPISLGQEYVTMVNEGVIAAQYVRSWRPEPEETVLLAPAYTFIIRNRPVDYQFWLNIGGRGWWERLYQPLTHPYVLSRHWPPPGREDETWTDSDEVAIRREALQRLTRGLVQRCRKKIFLGLSELGEQGHEQTGPLLKSIQKVLRGAAREGEPV